MSCAPRLARVRWRSTTDHSRISHRRATPTRLSSSSRAQRSALRSCSRSASRRELLTDCSPLNQREIKVAQLAIEKSAKELETWCGTGAFEISDQSSKAEAAAVAEKVFGRLSKSVDMLRDFFVKKHGAAAADAAMGAGTDVGLFKLATGVTKTDGATPAIAEQREIAALVAASVKEHLGEQWDKMSPEEQEACVKVWFVVAPYALQW